MEIVYKKRVVAFIDVLGFKNLIHSNEHDRLTKYYSFVLENFSAAAKRHDVEYLLISDSIVAHCEFDRAAFIRFSSLINTLQAGLLGKGILVRGALSFGELFVDPKNNIVVGNGLINAYQLEQRAKNPRIIIDRRLAAALFTGFAELVDECTLGGLPHITCSHPDGSQFDFPYLNYSRVIARSVSNPPLLEAINLVKNNYYLNDLVDKYEWLRLHLIEGLEAQQEFLSSLAALNKNSRARLRMAAKYIPELRQLGAPNNSSKPTPLRGPA